MGTAVATTQFDAAVLAAIGNAAVVGVATDISELRRVRHRAQRRARQQAAVAGLGRSALQDLDLDRLFDDAVKSLAEELDAPLAKVLEIDHDQQELWLRAGVGWHDGLVGAARVSDISTLIRAAFLRATSHELRTPLTVVTGLAATLRRARHELNEESISRILERMVVKGEHLQHLIEELLDVDRLNAGLVSAVIEPRNLRDLVESVLRHADIGERALTTRLEPVVTPVDAAKIERAVDNLVSNAVRHTPDDASICIEVSTSGGDAVIAVSDDGPGVDLDEPEEVFDPFVQGRERAADPTPGTGLGLTIVRQLTELHGGEATVRSLPGGGTRFEIRLPRTTGDDPLASEPS